jgi:RNA polymerase sigma-70 factor (ECF subfamily)
MPFDTQSTVSDDTLIARYASGDQSAARALTARHLGRVLALGQRMLGDQAEAEDIAQETMLRLWRHAPDWEPGRAQVGTWLYKVASNLCIDRLRKSRRTELVDVPEQVDERPTAEANLQARGTANAIAAALEGLPPRQKLALTLRFLEDHENPDIAEIMEISVDAVESLLARGKRALAAKLQDQRDDLL